MTAYSRWEHAVIQAGRQSGRPDNANGSCHMLDRHGWYGHNRYGQVGSWIPQPWDTGSAKARQTCNRRD